MTAVFVSDLADEVRSPQRLAAQTLADGSQAIQTRRCKGHATSFLDDDIVEVQVASRVASAGNVERVVTFVFSSRRKRIFKSPELILRTHPQRRGVRPKPHRSIERALKNR